MIPDWLYRLPIDTIDKVCRIASVPKDIVIAIAAHETYGTKNGQFAIRFEPEWKYFSNTATHARNLGITEKSERIFQMTGQGWMQIQGCVLRERGYEGMPFELLADDEMYFGFCCGHLKSIISRFGTDKSKIISCWNAGSPVYNTSGSFKNQFTYVDKVYNFLRDLEKLN